MLVAAAAVGFVFWEAVAAAGAGVCLAVGDAATEAPFIAGIATIALQAGHATRWPASLSGALSFLEH